MIEVFTQAEYWEGEERYGQCDWGCRRDTIRFGISVDGRIYEVCEDCLRDLQELFEEET